MLRDSAPAHAPSDHAQVAAGRNRAAAAALLSTTLIPENGGRPLAELPLHLLGHSRGSSLVSEIARLLGGKGVWVDQMTLWDPVDNTYGDATIGVWENVLFADDYYQQLGGFLIPQGQIGRAHV